MPARDARRRFRASERAALLIAAAGRCARCGAQLDPDFHADHCEPWVRGGRTDVTNGQALCPRCNRSKGATLPPKTTAPSEGCSKAARPTPATRVGNAEQHQPACPDGPAVAAKTRHARVPEEIS